MKITWVIPAYNEASRLPAFIDSLYQSFSAINNLSYQFLIVDDGSSETHQQSYQQLLADYQLKWPALHLLHLTKNKGKGHAIRQGWKHASKSDWYGFIDADGSISAEECLKISISISAINNTEPTILTCTRQGSIKPQRSPFRSFTSYLFTKIVSGLYDLPVSDTQCGCKVISKTIRAYTIQRSMIDDFLYDVELCLQAKHLGATLIERPIHWKEKKGSSISTIHQFQGVYDMSRLLVNYMSKTSPE